ncbi:potassium transporter TrkA [Arcobacter sp. CECT 8983]|uniref:potassium channel family protein n=2 Tax=unclassified Arcobacter TaxID=2593671 RepID=UPI00100B2AA0|nr:potassium channel family protein [Arcobacter sp. CECT 8983]RXJ90524.1 potassium transporter TrkA [Arcobacter sp. CECT 8983]
MENSSLFIVLQRMRKPFLVLIITYTIAIVGFLIIEGVDNNGNPYQMTIFDAFYFVTYTATTIGFGETPYEFTYAQRIWATASIYITVLGWFYAIGTLVSLLQDKLFIRGIKRTRFKRQVKGIKEKFIIILGYNQITHEVVNRAIEQGLRAVIVEKDEIKANEAILENFTPTVPVLVADAHSASAIEHAGIKSKYCRGLVSLFEDDSLNLRIALTSKLLNPHVKLVVKSTTNNHSDNLKDLDVEIVANPFSIISSEISMALAAPNLLKLEKWIYRMEDLNASLPLFPKGKYIICGYGRMGQHIYERLRHYNIEAQFVEIDKRKGTNFANDEYMHLTYGNADDKDLLLEVGIEEAVAIISATNDDTTNLSVLATAKKLNPKIMTIARENEMEDFSIFKSAKIDHIFMPSRILINKTTNALINPLSDKFIRLMCKKDDKWASTLVKDLSSKINEFPLLKEITIDKKNTLMIYEAIEKKEEITLKIFTRSLYNRDKENNIIPLLLQRGNEFTLLPSLDEKIEKHDSILFACDENAQSDIEYISQNIYEFHYALTGKEKNTIFKKD